mgnify:CR=1 FL=1
MTIDTYNLNEEQYTEFFHDNVRLAARLYLDAVNITVAEGIGNVDFKTLHEIYNDAIYATNDDCRRYQKEHNPEVIKDNDLFDLGPTRVEMMEEIKAINAKVDELNKSLHEYIEALIRTVSKMVDC